MKGRILWLAGSILMAGPVMAQRGDGPEVPLMRLEEEQTIRDQALALAEALKPTVGEVSESTVWVWTEVRGRNRLVALGTVVGDGDRVLTKWSEIALTANRVKVVGMEGKTAKATVLGVYEDQDLALLQLEGAVYPPVKWAPETSLELGRMLVAAVPGDSPGMVGVVSVEKRALNEKVYPALGILLDVKWEGKGVKVASVAEGSGAEEAGIQADDILLEFDGDGLVSAHQLQTRILRHAPGDTVKVKVQRGDETLSYEVKLTSRPKDQFSSGRLRQMESMGGRVNLIRDGFPSVVQTDLKIKADQCGGPVVNLEGQVVGISVARADRTRTLIIPASEVVSLLAVQPTRLANLRSRDPGESSLAQGRMPEGGGGPDGAAPAPQVVPLQRGSAERFMKHLQDMEKLLERMRTEMEGIE